MNKNVSAILAIICVVLLAGVCGFYYEKRFIDNKKVIDNKISHLNNNSVKPSGVNSVVQANNKFAFDIYSQYDSTPGNIFLSPYSISSAMAMVYEGAAGDTAQQISMVFGFPIAKESLRSSYADIFNNINKTDKKYQLSTANALWAQKNFAFLTNYFSVVGQYYGGKVTNLDFIGQTEQSRTTINNWVSDQTNNKINDLLPEGTIDSITRLVLTNAIYFKGNWVIRFDKTKTAEKNFKTSEQANVKVQMMQLTGENAQFNYSEDASAQVLEMPYEGNDLSMVLVLPKDNNLNSVEKIISAQKISDWTKSFQKQQINVYLPKFKFGKKYFMADTLKAMGMPIAFTAAADFSLMDGAKDLFIDKVIHQSYVEVNEEGTEAAAATGVTMQLTSANPFSIKTFTANHPFLFIIRQNSTGNILFLGRVDDPTISN